MKDRSVKRRLVALYEYVYSKTQVPHIRHQYSLHIMPMCRTIDYIAKNGCSVSRYGEGEFNIMFWTSKIKFQEQDDVLAEKMRSILENRHSNLLICVPGTIARDRGYNRRAKNWWRDWSKRRQKTVVTEIIKRTGKQYLFGDALFTRPYIDLSSKTKSAKIFGALKQLWDGKDLLIVEGDQTRLGVGNDLFSGATSIKRILAPAENAFSRYDEILDAVKRHHHGELILLALGPTATVLAADLASETCQAIDIGHIDIEYEWYLAGATEKTAVKGKYTNEVVNGRGSSECLDEGYLGQIVEKIG